MRSSRFQRQQSGDFSGAAPGGRFILANLHLRRSATGGWHKTADGAKHHAILDRYFDEGECLWPLLGVEFTNFHTTLSTYTRAYIEAGFAIEGIIEPTVETELLSTFSRT